jgi:UPF0271 protein
MDAGELADEVFFQIGALDGMCRAAGTRVRYVKPHGAPYNATVHHEEQRGRSSTPCGPRPGLPVLGCPARGCSPRPRRPGRAVSEFFVDRGYTPEGALVPRARHGALLHDPQEVTARMVRMVTDGVVTAVDGSEVRVHAESACVHGDSPGAVAMAAAVRDGLKAAGVELRAFV